MNSNWIINLKNHNTAKIDLLFFHHAGGAASFFRKFTNYLLDINIYAIQLPGREQRYSEKYISNFNELLVNLKQYVKPFLQNDLIIFGHSLGAFIAYEFTKILNHCDLKFVKHLIVSGAESPSLFNVNKYKFLHQCITTCYRRHYFLQYLLFTQSMLAFVT